MRKFTFYDTDSTGQAEYDICSAEYAELLNKCFQYSYAFSVLLDLRAPNAALPFANLEQYRIPVTENVKKIYDHYGYFEEDTCNGYEIRHYLLCEDVKKAIIHVTDSIFKWICGWGYTNPTDPVFYRKDGSVFFCSLIHEGVCTLVVTEEENIDTVIQESMWRLE